MEQSDSDTRVEIDEASYPLEILRRELAAEEAALRSGAGEESETTFDDSIDLGQFLESELVSPWISAEVDYLLAEAPRVEQSFKSAMDRGARRGLEALNGVLSDRRSLVEKLKSYESDAPGDDAQSFSDFVSKLSRAPIAFESYPEEKYVSWITNLDVPEATLLSSVHPRHAASGRNVEDVDELVLVAAATDTWALFRDRVERAVRAWRDLRDDGE